MALPATSSWVFEHTFRVSEHRAAGLLVQPGVRAGVQVLRLDAVGGGQARRQGGARFFSAARALSHSHAGSKKRPARVPGE